MSPEPITIEFRKVRETPVKRHRSRVTAKHGKVPTPKKKKAKTLSKYKKELDAIFSLFVRQRDGGQCYTCPKKDEVKKMQNGHFVPRQYLAVRWDEVNCHCQCYACNVLYNGQPSAYAARLEKDYGQGTVEMLESKRKILTKLDKEFYEYWIAHYRSLTVDKQ